MILKLTGKNLINGNWCINKDHQCAHSELLNVDFAVADEQQINSACLHAAKAFRPFANRDRHERAHFLREIAVEIEYLAEQITEIAQQETGLPETRLVAERGRTIAQINMFADLIESRDYLNIQHTRAIPDRQPLARPDLRLLHRAVGPVVVFGASNFPLAFSVAGGDTASALAAGCPVIVKAHEAHPGTSELVAQAIYQAIQKCELPKAVFQMLHGDGRCIGRNLVTHNEIAAVGFTGSLTAGRILFDLCHNRAKPIPFYGELGSINPVFMLPQAGNNRLAEIAKNWLDSLTLGVGQFCTKPGVIFMLKGKVCEQFKKNTKNAIKGIDKQPMLTKIICQKYYRDIATWRYLAHEIITDKNADDKHATPSLFSVEAKTWLKHSPLQHEVFGPAGLIVECQDSQQMLHIAESLEGQLTLSMQLDDADMVLAKDLTRILQDKAGRILCNHFPTGVEVCSAMMHGGPYPSSTDIKATSVGSLAINRWLRPVCYQNFPEALLPVDLTVR